MKPRVLPLWLLLALALPACGEGAGGAPTVNEACAQFTRVIETQFSREEVDRFLVVMRSFAQAKEAPGLEKDVEEFGNAVRKGDAEGVQTMFEIMGYYCEGYWAVRGLPEGMEWKSLEEILQEAGY